MRSSEYSVAVKAKGMEKVKTDSGEFRVRADAKSEVAVLQIPGMGKGWFEKLSADLVPRRTFWRQLMRVFFFYRSFSNVLRGWQKPQKNRQPLE